MPKQLTDDDQIVAALQRTPIAIIGMGALMPEAKNLTEYWQNIIQMKDCLKEIPDTHWNVDDYYDPDPTAEDKTYCTRGGFIPEIKFNPLEFGLPPNILEVTDASQLLGLVVAKAALEDAGYGPDSGYSHNKTGAILGVCGGQKMITPLGTRLQYPEWKKALLSSGLNEEEATAMVEKMKTAFVRWEENAFPGLLGNVISGRIANRFDLGGTNCVVDAACASSLSALKMAVTELTDGEADLMISGGVDTDNSIFMYMCFSKTPALSRSGEIRPFSSDADGMMLGEGIGMVVLKRLADAERDNDRIYAVIRGIGSSSDGRYKSIYAPRAAGQLVALRRAYDQAGFSPATVGLIEAHGTGTPAGDPTEFESINQLFSEEKTPLQQVALGSVKSQIGHTKAAAGAAGLIKATLAIHHKILPPSIKVTAPNPKLDISHSPFYINSETRPWIGSANHPRRAGVSAFGFGGTNFHVVIEEYQKEQQTAYRLNQIAHSIIVTAPTHKQLQEKVSTTINQLHSESSKQSFEKLVAESATISIEQSHPRLGFVAQTKEETIQQLQLTATLLQKHSTSESWEHPKGIYYHPQAVNPKGKIVALFPGQGTQYLNMGKELFLDYPIGRDAVAQLDQLFQQDNRPPLSQIISPIPPFSEEERTNQQTALQQTEYAQPAIGSLSFTYYKLLQQAGFQPDIVAGHSFGELTALWAAEVVTDTDYFKLVRARGKAMAPPKAALNFDPGTMVAVQANGTQLSQCINGIKDITLANLNAPNQTIIAGPKSAINEAVTKLNEHGFTTTQLPTSAAFHTPLVAHAQAAFAQLIEKTTFHTPKIPIYSNATGTPYSNEPKTIEKALADHILQPVHFQKEIESIYDEGGYFFVEIGPKTTLSNLVKTILHDRPHMTIPLNHPQKGDATSQFQQALLQLRLAGIPLQQTDKWAQQTIQKEEITPRLQIPLSGANYVSDKTKQLFIDQLESGFQLDRPLNKPSSNTPTNPPEITPPTIVEKPTPTVTNQNISINKAVVQLEELLKAQQEAHQLHGAYLQSQLDYAHGVIQLLQQQTATHEEKNEQIEHIQLLHQHQTETLALHEQYLMNGNPPTTSIRPQMNEPMEAQSIVSKPESLSTTNPAIDSSIIAEHLLTIVADKTGYPVDMLELEMDLEADLGIDSIKRVEILGALQEQFPNLPDLPTDLLAELRTLAQISNQLAELPLASITNGHIDLPEEPVNKIEAARVPKNNRSTDASIIAEHLLTIVADKTGYPVDMLELEMDLEADLGIDSIKRVEILGALQEQFPNLPDLPTDLLAELRTLAQISAQLAELPLTAAPTEATTATAEQKAPHPATAPSTHHQLNQPTKDISPTIRIARAKLKPLPHPDQLLFDFPDGRICLITDDGSDLTNKLIYTLQEKGWPTAVLSFPNELIPRRFPLPETTHYQLETMEEEELNNTLSKIGPIAAFIHLNPILPPSQNLPTPFLELEKQLLRHIFLIAKQLKQPLEEAGADGRATFLTVARLDGEFGMSRSHSFSPISGGLFGLTKSLNLEWDWVFCRALDLAPNLETDELLTAILSELHDPNQLLTEVGYTWRGRTTIIAKEGV